ncbi:hypothetical protein TWF281_008615 [Arthrobotrys megalospora]
MDPLGPEYPQPNLELNNFNIAFHGMTSQYNTPTGASRLTVSSSPSDAISNTERNKAARLHNGQASCLASTLHPVAKTAPLDNVTLYETPDYFPKSAGEFLNMNVSQVVYLLEFYKLRVFGAVYSPNGISALTSLSTEVQLNVDVVASNFNACLEQIALYIGLDIRPMTRPKVSQYSAVD